MATRKAMKVPIPPTTRRPASGSSRPGSGAPEPAHYSTLISTADKLLKTSPAAALPLYTRALHLQPASLAALCARSRAYMLANNFRRALDDATAALGVDPNSTKAMICRADALYAMGELEEALVWYHRGDGTDGVERCKEGILKVVGGWRPDSAARSLKQDAIPEFKKAPVVGPVIHPGITGSVHARRSNPALNVHQPPPVLEDLQDDLIYLRQLAADASMMSAANGDVGRLIESGLEYLDSRIEFWRARGGIRSARPRSARRRDMSF
ncbi:Tetratricopeptide repeat protein 25 [Gaertneriomyces sp. JEL0708]|nr:Tetratricopeptide repeat protein 25 [Gaertneriomyces sp. JEL0708]